MNELKTNIPEMLGVKETADKFGVSCYYIRKLALSGKVKAVRAGRGKILVNVQSVAEYFNSTYINAVPAPDSNN